MNRRTFLAAGLASVAAGSFSKPANPDFSFVHFTDVHIQDELQAATFTRRCFEQINRHRPSFSVSGGDLVFDVNAANPDKARHLFDLYLETRKLLDMPVYHAIGNHDVYGTRPPNPSSVPDTMNAKAMFEAQIGKPYYSFDFRDWHFIVLDSINLAANGDYSGFVDEDQMKWLEADLRRSGKDTPTVITTHIPLVTGFLQYGDLAATMPADQLVIRNSRNICDLISNYSVKAVLQGHTHICEQVVYKGCQYITTGAVCGNWWKGPRLGFPEGYNLVQVHEDHLEVRYVPYSKN